MLSINRLDCITPKGKCPHCTCSFNAEEATPTFPAIVSSKEKVILEFAFCPKCYEEFAKGGEQQQTKFIKTSINNIVTNRQDEWTITNNLALAVHSGSFLNAWQYGSGIPKPIFDLINQGFIEDIVVLPSSIGRF